MSERRACSTIKADRKTVRYRSRRAADAALRTRMRELAAERRRFGYRRLHVLLRQEGLVRNRKRTQRLYREEGLTVRRRPRPQARHRRPGAAALASLAQHAMVDRLRAPARLPPSLA